MNKRRNTGNKAAEKSTEKAGSRYTGSSGLIPILIRNPQLHIVEKGFHNSVSLVSVEKSDANVKNTNTNTDSEGIASCIQKISVLESDKNDLEIKLMVLQAENRTIKRRMDHLEQMLADLKQQTETEKSGAEKAKKTEKPEAAKTERTEKSKAEKAERTEKSKAEKAERTEKPEAAKAERTQKTEAAKEKEDTKKRAGTEQTGENSEKKTSESSTAKQTASDAKTNRRKTAMEISRRIWDELSSSGNYGQTPVISFGSYVQDPGGTRKPIQWRVLSRKGKTMLLLSDKILDVKPYHNSNMAVTWETCDLRRWLNVDFVKEAFHGEEEFMLKYAEIENHNNSSYSIRGGKNTKDRVFLLSEGEYYQYFPNKIFAKTNASEAAKSRQLSCRPGTDYGYWWLRTPGSGVVKAAQVNPDGNLITYGGNVTENRIGVRPAIWLELK